MQGPFKPGLFQTLPAATGSSWEQRVLQRGERYVVIKDFTDTDGDMHLVGENWTFLGSTFSKFDDELTIFVLSTTDHEWKIPLIWKVGAQQEVIERWANFVAKLSSKQVD